MTGQQPSPTPNTAMASGNDDAVDDRHDDVPLDEGERAVLDALAEPGQPVVEAIEDTPEARAAVCDDAPLPEA